MATPRKAGGVQRVVERVGAVTIYKRGGRYWLYWRQHGRTRRDAVGRQKKEAVRRATEIDSQMSYGLPSLFGFEKTTVAKLIPRWLEYHDLVARSSVNSIKHYRSCARHLLNFLEKDCPLITVDQFSPGQAEDFVKYLRRTKISPNGKPGARKRLMSDRNIINVLQVCRNVFNYALRRRHLPPYSQNPFHSVKVEKMAGAGIRRMRLFTLEEETEFLETCDDWEFPVSFTAAFTGMRPGELMHLLIEDVSFGEKLLYIRNRPELGWLTKTRRERQVYIFDELAAALKRAINGRRRGVLFLNRYVTRGDREVPLLGWGERDLEVEFARRIEEYRSSNGGENREKEAPLAKRLWADMGAMNGNEYRRTFARIAARIGRPDVTKPHIWRHAMASVMQMGDMDPLMRQEILGHASLETTRLYTHPNVETMGMQMGKVLAIRTDSLEAARKRLAKR